MRYKPLTIALGCALSLASVTLATATQAADVTTPIAGAAEVKEIVGNVVAIDEKTRKMTLKTPEGAFEVLTVPPEVKHIERIKIGNKVTVSETEAVLVDLQKGRNAGAMGAIGSTTVEPAPGRKPAGTIIEKLTLYGKVVAVDRAASQVTVRGPNRTVTLKVQDPAILKDLAPGNGVIATYVRAITGKVEFQ
jgi:Cu/Ag efflux protein CusF